jgi:hypothetical protein
MNSGNDRIGSSNNNGKSKVEKSLANLSDMIRPSGDENLNESLQGLSDLLRDVESDQGDNSDAESTPDSDGDKE